MPVSFRVGTVQAAALDIYVFDPVFDEPLDDEDQQPFPGSFDGTNLTIDDPAAAWRVLVDAANSADEDNDPQLRDALQKLQRRALRLTARS